MALCFHHSIGWTSVAMTLTVGGLGACPIDPILAADLYKELRRFKMRTPDFVYMAVCESSS